MSNQLIFAYHNNQPIHTVFYGNMTEAEKNTSKNLVKANAVNLNAALGEVLFVEKMKDVLEVMS